MHFKQNNFILGLGYVDVDLSLNHGQNKAKPPMQYVVVEPMDQYAATKYKYFT